MAGVHTLRVTFGHPKFTEALLRCFFDSNRERKTPVKKLWLENVRVVEGTEMKLDMHKYSLPLQLDFSGLESVRIRRLPLKAFEMSQEQRVTNRGEFNYSRAGTATELQNGQGGNYLTFTTSIGAEVVSGHEELERILDNEDHLKDPTPLENLMFASNTFDDGIYQDLSREVDLPQEVQAAAVPSYYWRSILAYQDRWLGPREGLDPEAARMFRQLFRTDLPSPGDCALSLFQSASATLTQLTIDWAMSAPLPLNVTGPDYDKWVGWYASLFSLRFPHLQVFQYRNAIVKETLLPPGLFLLDESTIYTGTGKSITRIEMP